jgi:hypothetical protein
MAAVSYDQGSRMLAGLEDVDKVAIRIGDR